MFPYQLFSHGMKTFTPCMAYHHNNYNCHYFHLIEYLHFPSFQLHFIFFILINVLIDIPVSKQTKNICRKYGCIAPKSFRDVIFPCYLAKFFRWWALYKFQMRLIPLSQAIINSLHMGFK